MLEMPRIWPEVCYVGLFILSIFMMPYTMVAFVEWFRSGMPFPPKQKLSIDDQIVFTKVGIVFFFGVPSLLILRLYLSDLFLNN